MCIYIYIYIYIYICVYVSLTDRTLETKIVNVLCFEENSATDHNNYCLYMLLTNSEIEKQNSFKF